MDIDEELKAIKRRAMEDAAKAIETIRDGQERYARGEPPRPGERAMTFTQACIEYSMSELPVKWEYVKDVGFCRVVDLTGRCPLPRPAPKFKVT